MESLLLTFAELYNLAPSEAYVLPVLFAKAASEADMDLALFVDTAIYRNKELGEYMAVTARTIASTLEAL